MLRRTLLAAACTAVLAATIPTVAASAAPDARPAAVDPAPKVGDCWLYASFSDWIDPAISPAKKVPCSEPHNAVTTSVGRIPKSITNPYKDSLQAKVASGLKCAWYGQGGAAAVLGVPANRPLRLSTSSFLPSKAQWNAGQRWTRCDTAIPDGKTIDMFPTNMAAWAKNFSESTLCYLGSPLKKGNRVRACTHSWNWKAVPKYIDLGSKFPGKDGAFAKAHAFCRKHVSRELQQSYVFFVPTTQDAWDMGLTKGVCYTDLGQNL